MTPSPRAVALAIAAGRIGIGVGALAATRPALRALGFEQTDAAGEALAKIAGGRDVALGLLAFALRDDPRALRSATLLAAGVDAADAIVFAAAGRRPEMRRAGLGGGLSGSAAALAGVWSGRRLDR